jgi:hypothetical protein
MCLPLPICLPFRSAAEKSAVSPPPHLRCICKLSPNSHPLLETKPPPQGDHPINPNRINTLQAKQSWHTCPPPSAIMEVEDKTKALPVQSFSR